MSALDEPAGTRSTAAGYNRNDAYYQDATASQKNELRESGPNPREYLQQGGGRKKPSLSASARKKIAPVFRAAPLVRPKSAATVVPFDDMPIAAKPPLAAMLEDRGFGKALIRKLCDDMSCTHVKHLLALDRPQFDALCDSLRPAPGIREQLKKFLADERSKAEDRRQQEREQPGSSERPTTAPPTGQQRKAWKASLNHLRYSTTAAKRGNDGHVAHLIHEQPTWWGKGNGGPPQSKAYVSRVRVLMINGSRVCVFDGPRPNATGGKARVSPGTINLGSTTMSSGAGLGDTINLRGGYDRDAF